MFLLRFADSIFSGSKTGFLAAFEISVFWYEAYWCSLLVFSAGGEVRQLISFCQVTDLCSQVPQVSDVRYRLPRFKSMVGLHFCRQLGKTSEGYFWTAAPWLL